METQSSGDANGAGSMSDVMHELMDAGHQIHVRGIGVDGWDGTEEGRGTYENEQALAKIFAPFGQCLSVKIRHRIDVADGANTSWALVTMATSDAVEAALAAPAVMAGQNKLKLTRFNKKMAKNSQGAMRTLGSGLAATVSAQTSQDRVLASLSRRAASTRTPARCPSSSGPYSQNVWREGANMVSCHDIAAIWVAFFSRWQRYRCGQVAGRPRLCPGNPCGTVGQPS